LAARERVGTVAIEALTAAQARAVAAALPPAGPADEDRHVEAGPDGPRLTASPGPGRDDEEDAAELVGAAAGGAIT
jgi:hypothetical protein